MSREDFQDRLNRLGANAPQPASRPAPHRPAPGETWQHPAVSGFRMYLNFQLGIALGVLGGLGLRIILSEIGVVFPDPRPEQNALGLGFVLFFPTVFLAAVVVMIARRRAARGHPRKGTNVFIWSYLFGILFLLVALAA